MAFAAAIVALLIPAPVASADFHFMSVREVFPGASNSSYVVLQMYAAGQNNLNGHNVRAYGPTGTLLGTHTFSGATIGTGANQSTVLVADDGYAAAFPGGPSPDRTEAAFNLQSSGGAVCFDSIDCVSWGSFSGSVSPAAGSPASPGGVTVGKALRRVITGGTCTGQLDANDDGNNSSAEFVEVDPNPRSSGSTIIETSCSAPSGPTVTIGTKPAAKTKSTSAEFTFTSNPAGATFECKLDSEPAFTVGCTSPKIYSGPLAPGGHTFQVRGENVNGKGPIASHAWEVDLTPPTTTISNPTPPNPNSGSSLTFKYTSNESGSTFGCSMVKVGNPDAFSSCPATGKTYSALQDGNYVFKVRSTDQAGNEGAATEYPFTVDTSLKDTTAPETTITGKPSDPSSSTTAAFTYESTEAGSTFQCKMDAEAFAACPPEGKTYTGLTEGQHTFQVRATDTSANTDASPAGATFSIVLPTETPVVPVVPVTPPGETPVAPDTRLTGKPKPKSKDRTPTFKFTSTVTPASFECQLDSKPFKACRSPFTAPVKPGRHGFKVRAVGPTGLKDPSPASFSFKVVKPK